MDQSLDKVIFLIIGLTKCSKPTRPNQPVYRAYAEGELLCPVKCIYAYLAQRSEMVTKDFTEFLITFGKPHHPGLASSLGERSDGKFWYRYRNLQTSYTRVVSNSAAYKLGMPLQEVPKRGQWSNLGAFFTYCFREIEDLLDEQQHT